MKTIVVRTVMEGAGSGLESSSLRRSMFEAGPAAEAAARTEISIADLSERERTELEGQPDYLTAEPMPLNLIAPVQRADESVADPAADYAPYLAGTVDGGVKVAWGVAAVGAAASQFTGRDVPVAVLDTGIDRAHPAFDDPTLNIVEQNFTNSVDHDTDGHGTHCAGTIFGRDVDGVRIGIARGVTQAFIGKVLPGDSADLLAAMRWAFDAGARVISMSLGYDFPGWVAKLRNRFGIGLEAAVSMALQDFRRNIAAFDATMSFFQARALSVPGAVVVAASGNESKRNPPPPDKAYTIAASIPSAAMGVISIGALDRSADGLRIARFSNTQPHLCAPGVDVLSARRGSAGLMPMSGTSMACPHVAGLAALYWDQLQHQGLGRLNAETVLARLRGRARTESLSPGFSAADVGDGLAVAP